jgi:hypothetical protein
MSDFKQLLLSLFVCFWWKQNLSINKESYASLVNNATAWFFFYVGLGSTLSEMHRPLGHVQFSQNFWKDRLILDRIISTNIYH